MQKPIKQYIKENIKQLNLGSDRRWSLDKGSINLQNSIVSLVWLYVKLAKYNINYKFWSETFEIFNLTDHDFFSNFDWW